MTGLEARELDGQILNLMRHRRMRHVVACRLMYHMSTDGYHALGYPTFRSYLRARRIPRRWALHLRGVYHRLAIELRLPEQEWLDIPLSRLQGVLRIISAQNVQQVLADARVMSGDAFRGHLQALRGVRQLSPRGLFQLVPADRPHRMASNSRRRMRGTVFAADDGTWYVDLCS